MSVSESDFELLGEWRDHAPDYRGAVILPVDLQGRVLLQLRDRNPAAIHPGEWGMFGGGVEPEEPLDAAARREFAEETGVKIPADVLKPFVRLVAPMTRLRLYVFEARMDIAPRDLRLGEGAGFGFFEPRDFGGLTMIGAVRVALAHWARTRA
ncbi:MAG: NUDIX domain-containing protein [Pseudomonadota bacterium]